MSLSDPPTSIDTLRAELIEKILSRQDGLFRWGYSERQARQKPETIHYAPNFRSTLWTLVLLADLQAPAGLPQVEGALRLLAGHFFSPPDGIFRLPVEGYFPIPCLNGNLLYLHHAFGVDHSGLDSTIRFFSDHQRFDDGGFRTPSEYPYLNNHHCYGAHTCFWGVAKLFKGLVFQPEGRRFAEARRLLGNCIEFILHHRVCFSSRHPDRLLHPDIARLSFPCFYKTDLLELLWLLARAGVQDPRLAPALDMLRARRGADGWTLDRAPNTIVPVGEAGAAHPFLTARALETLDVYGS